jgi:YVTN family beta-propeller protein
VRKNVCILFILSALTTLLSCSDPDSRLREFVYVTNGGSNTVSVVDGMNFRTVATIAVGQNPTGIAANPRRDEVYVVNTASKSVSVIDAQSNKVVATISVGARPYFISMANTGDRGYVANAADGTLSIIDLAARRVLDTIPIGKAAGLAQVSPDGNSVVISSREQNSVSVVDPQQRRVRATIAVCTGPGDIAILPDSSKAFVACDGSSEVAAIQLKNAARQQDNDALLAILKVGKTPTSLALKPDGGEIFSTNFDSGTVSEIATGANEVGGSYNIGAGPTRAILASDNATMFVSNFNADTVATFDVTVSKFLANSLVHVGSRPDAMALSSGERYLYVANSGSGDLSVINVFPDEDGKRKQLAMVSVGSKPNAIAVKAILQK